MTPAYVSGIIDSTSTCSTSGGIQIKIILLAKIEN